jgi:hypothetical protein
VGQRCIMSDAHRPRFAESNAPRKFSRLRHNARWIS